MEINHINLHEDFKGGQMPSGFDSEDQHSDMGISAAQKMIHHTVSDLFDFL